MKRHAALGWAFLISLILACAASYAHAHAFSIRESAERAYDTSLGAWYRETHARPELSLAEAETSRRFAAALRGLGFETVERVGGYGVVGTYRNGAGKTVLLRADLDALPVAERTGLPYASSATGMAADGSAVPVMHACGHDAHLASALGAAAVLLESRARWSGTLVVVGQPAEELGTGARSMLADGLYERFLKPDHALAIHVTERRPAGTVELISGPAGANVDTVTITVRGKGAHGSRPHQSVDPIVLASAIVMRLQTVVSREVDPVDAAVVTVGSFHAGAKENVIPETAELKLTVRTLNPATRAQVLASIERIANAEALASGAPAPTIAYGTSLAAPYNHPDVVARILPVLQAELGRANAVPAGLVTLGGEDFGELLRDGVTGAMIHVGAVPAGVFEEWQSGAGERWGIHSPLFAPDPRPTIVTGARALAASALELFRSP